MSLFDPALKEKLWHKMREDLSSFFPGTHANHLLMCCMCGRFLPYGEFNLEHIIPKQVVNDDPPEIKANPKATINVRSANILLCNKPLKIGNKPVHGGGCNSWKGSVYDKSLRELLNGNILDHQHRNITDRHLIALLCLAHLAMVREYGYQIALTQSGMLMRQQFFSPNRFHANLPLNSQFVLGTAPIQFDESIAGIWLQPFKFKIEHMSCIVTIRSWAVRVPLARDPRIPIAKNLVMKPARYKLRPDFSTVFH